MTIQKIPPQGGPNATHTIIAFTYPFVPRSSPIQMKINVIKGAISILFLTFRFVEVAIGNPRTKKKGSKIAPVSAKPCVVPEYSELELNATA